MYGAHRRALAPPTPGQLRTGPVVGVLAAAGIVASLTQTLVVPLIGSLPEIFAADPSTTSWVVTITLLTGAVATPVLGRLADMYGKRRMILIALVPMVVGSALCALAPNVAVMIAGRGLQGLAGVVPLGISLLHDVLPRERVAGAIALMSSSMGIGGALGLPIASAVIELTSWRLLFWATGVVAALLTVAVARLVPAPTPVAGSGGRFDFAGAAGLGSALVCLLLAVSKGNAWGWDNPVTLGLLAAGAALLAVWGWWELRTPHRLVDLRTIARPVVAVTNLAAVFVGFSVYAQSLLTPQLMQLSPDTGHGFGRSMLQMGLLMAPAGLAMMAVSYPGARLTNRHGPKATLVLGTMVMALGYGAAAVFMDSLWALSVSAAVVSAGVGLAFGAMPALIMGEVPATEKAAANAFNALMRSIGISISSAVVAVVLAARTTFVAREHSAVPAADAFQTGFLLGAGVAVVAAVAAALIPVTRGRAGGTGAAVTEQDDLSEQPSGATPTLAHVER